MKIEITTVEKMAQLARLDLKPEEVTHMRVDMEQILTWMEKLNELDTSEVDPLMHLSLEINALREDQVTESLEHSKALKNAPLADADFFLVPKVIERD